MTQSEHEALKAEAEAHEQTDSVHVQLATTKEQILRINADFDNFRRRTERERVEWANIARVTVLKKFLPITDDIERALGAFHAQADVTDSSLVAALEGLSLVQKNLTKALHEMGVEEITSQGAFNPEFHEALMQVDGNGQPAGTIMQVFEKGYKLGDTIVRHSKVSVAK